jgi:hypothetical protein
VEVDSETKSSVHQLSAHLKAKAATRLIAILSTFILAAQVYGSGLVNANL